MADNPRRRGRSRPESPRVFGGRWQVVKELPSGGQGTAFLVRDVNGENADAQYVLKQLRIRRPGERHEWQQKRLDRFEREIAALRRLDLSPNIPSVVDSYVGSKGAYFVTPYAGKNLEKMRNLVEPASNIATVPGACRGCEVRQRQRSCAPRYKAEQCDRKRRRHNVFSRFRYLHV